VSGVPFNAHAGLMVRRWEADGVEMVLPYAEHLSAHPGVFHGGVISALIDTAGCGAVAAGHDFDKGSRITTVALSIQFLTVAPGEDAVAHAACTRRGQHIHQAHVVVRAVASDRELAEGLVTVHIAGERPGLAAVTQPA
jgi:uncharacterized protein (TIGR00369 family)